MSRILEEHVGYFTDQRRLELYAGALMRCIRPDDVVLDLGCGTGVLGLLACRAGARRVYAIDSGAILDVARTAASDNGFGDRIIHLRGRSLDLVLPEPATVIVSDQMGPLGYEFGLLQFTADAKTRLAAPGARYLPSSITTLLAPVEQPRHHTRVAAWSRDTQGLSLHAFRRHAANSTYPVGSDFGELLAPGAVAWHLPLDQPDTNRSRIDGHADWTIVRAGQLNGLLAWFQADLCEGVVLTNAPTDPGRINRACRYLPLDPPFDVSEGDRIEARLHARPGNDLINWRVTLTRGGAPVATWSQSTLLGSVELGDGLASRRPNATPSVSLRARAKATLLECCDGTRDMGSLTALVVARHPSLWHSPEEAEGFVRQTLRDLGSDVTW